VRLGKEAQQRREQVIQQNLMKIEARLAEYASNPFLANRITINKVERKGDMSYLSQRVFGPEEVTQFIQKMRLVVLKET
jgi:ribosome-binding factor A